MFGTDTAHWRFGDKKSTSFRRSRRSLQRCILMTTDPGDLVLDPTCGSGTTAYVAEQWGRRWITIDTSRVAIALARSRLMGARYPYYLLADSPEGQRKEGEVTRTPPKTTPTQGNIRHGFVYERVPHITLEIHRQQCRDRRDLGEVAGDAGAASGALNKTLGKAWEEWEIPREPAILGPEARRSYEAARSARRRRHRQSGKCSQS